MAQTPILLIVGAMLARVLPEAPQRQGLASWYRAPADGGLRATARRRDPAVRAELMLMFFFYGLGGLLLLDKVAGVAVAGQVRSIVGASHQPALRVLAAALAWLF